MPDLNALPQVVWNALQAACLMLPLASAVTVQAAVTKTLDVGLAAIYLLVAYLAVALLPTAAVSLLLIAAIGAVGIGALLGAAHARLLFLRYLYDPDAANDGSRNAERVLIGSIALYLIVEASIRLVAGNAARSIAPLDLGRFDVFGVQDAVTTLVMVIAALAIWLVFALFMRGSLFGLWARAADDSASLARLYGLRSRPFLTLVFAIGGALCASSALFRSLTADVTPSMALPAFLWAITAAVVGGVGSIQGALIGCLILGFAEHFSGWIFGAEWRATAVLTVGVAFLLLRPTGVVGRSALLATR